MQYSMLSLVDDKCYGEKRSRKEEIREKRASLKWWHVSKGHWESKEASHSAGGWKRMFYTEEKANAKTPRQEPPWRVWGIVERSVWPRQKDGGRKSHSWWGQREGVFRGMCVWRRGGWRVHCVDFTMIQLGNHQKIVSGGVRWSALWLGSTSATLRKDCWG